MNDRTSVNEQIAMASTDKSVAISTVGYMCIAISWWMTGMLLAGWFKPVANMGIDTSTLYGVGSVLLVIMGILSLAYGRRVLDAIVFLATAGLFFSLHNGSGGFFTGGVPSAYIGWWGLVWAVFFCYLWIASFRTGDTTRMLFLLLFWLGALALAIRWMDGERWILHTRRVSFAGYRYSRFYCFGSSRTDLPPRYHFQKECQIREYPGITASKHPMEPDLVNDDCG
jgi:hypothetical protein